MNWGDLAFSSLDLLRQICMPAAPESIFGLVWVKAKGKSLGATFQWPPWLKPEKILNFNFFRKWRNTIPSGTAVKKIHEKIIMSKEVKKRK